MDRLRAAYRVSVIIGLAMMASLLVYTVIVGVFEKGGRPSGTEAFSGSELEIVKFCLMGVSVIIFFLIRFLSARILAVEEGPGGRSRPTSGALPDIQRLTTASVVTYALCEAPAILGLVLFFLGGQASDFHLFLLVSLFFFAVHFPRFSNWEDWFRHRQGPVAK